MSALPRAGYPKRPAFFAYQFCRLLGKACAANDIGPEACWLLSVIAHTEAARGYRGPVTFFNEQLLPMAGFGSVEALDRARVKAVRAGWLHYERGGKGRPGRYWVTIPPENLGWDDAPSDESTPVYFRENAEVTAEATERKQRKEPTFPLPKRKRRGRRQAPARRRPPNPRRL